MNDLNIIEADGIRLAQALASAITSGSGSATLDPVQANIAGKTVDATATIAVSKGTAAPKGSALNDALRLAEAFVQAVLTGSSTATLDPFGYTIAGETIVVQATVAVTAR